MAVGSSFAQGAAFSTVLTTTLGSLLLLQLAVVPLYLSSVLFALPLLANTTSERHQHIRSYYGDARVPDPQLLQPGAP
eukprot:2584539-Rhodomonas_salina.1